MAARKSNADPKRDAFVAAPTPAAAARTLGIDGKRVRNALRSKLGVFVSKDASAYTPAVRSALYDIVAPKSESK
jgi:hypothetical protein